MQSYHEEGGMTEDKNEGKYRSGLQIVGFNSFQVMDLPHGEG